MIPVGGDPCVKNWTKFTFVMDTGMQNAIL